MFPESGKGSLAGLTFSHGREKGHEQQIGQKKQQQQHKGRQQKLKYSHHRGNKKSCKETVYFERILQ